MYKTGWPHDGHISGFFKDFSALAFKEHIELNSIKY